MYTCAYACRARDKRDKADWLPDSCDQIGPCTLLHNPMLTVTGERNTTYYRPESDADR